MKDIPRAKARRLKLDDPRVVRTYLTKLDAIFKTKKLYSRLKSLKKAYQKGPYTPAIKVEYEAIDKI